VTAPSPSKDRTGGVLTIDLAAIVANWRLLAGRAAPAECAAVVKADAYGCGIPDVVAALAKAGARTFFVAHAFEGLQARSAAPDAAVYVLNGLVPGSAADLLQQGLRPVLGSMAEIEEWAQAAGGAPAAIHVDTGMNRLGLTPEEARGLAARIASGALPVRPSLVMSHLACADEPDHPLNARQLAAFRGTAAHFPGVATSLANSAATHQAGHYRFDLCRPGVALYGGNPYADRPNPMAPAVRLEARIIQVRDVPSGETVGYGAAQKLNSDTRVAILSLGYADGYFRLAGSATDARGAEVIVSGVRCPLVGRVSMDLVAVDVTAVQDAARGDMAVLLGDGITVDDLAAHARTIGYEVLTNLGHRYHRVYRQA
jgi:alanine racemase